MHFDDFFEMFLAWAPFFYREGGFIEKLYKNLCYCLDKKNMEEGVNKIIFVIIIFVVLLYQVFYGQNFSFRGSEAIRIEVVHRKIDNSSKETVKIINFLERPYTGFPSDHRVLNS